MVLSLPIIHTPAHFSGECKTDYMKSPATCRSSQEAQVKPHEERPNALRWQPEEALGASLESDRRRHFMGLHGDWNIDRQ